MLAVLVERHPKTAVTHRLMRLTITSQPDKTAGWLVMVVPDYS